nr:immunoglobulin light chain junction region [Macaca mulatta]MOW70236.1 immunoglobulin light chain junction region [Macaca mulatta]
DYYCMIWHNNIWVI